jgi:poly-gamma-glutamate capsule biosynthesis protein CapA/YwtB (metallophosphatase superfamily)
MDERTTLTLALTGDNMITRHALVGEDQPTRELIGMLREADVTFGNLEVLPNDFRGHPAQESGGTHLAARTWVVDELLSSGYDLLSCATNHALDYSIEGLLATIETLEQKGVAFAGVGRNLAEARMPVYVERGGGTVAMISCCSTFAKGQLAGEQRPDLPGRPGLNPLRFATVYDVSAEQIAAIQAIADDLGVEQQRLDRLQLGFGFPPDDPDLVPLLDLNFRAAEKTAIRTSPSEPDIQAITAWVHEARGRSDLVIVSLHAHEQGATREDPAEFIPIFARRMIDEGADLVVGHGPHLLRGMEVYKGKPIFYSLGNFIAQNDLVHVLPADSYARFRVDPSKTPGEIARTRSNDGQKGFPADRRYWESVMSLCHIERGRLIAIELIPVTLGFGDLVYRRGRPRRADGEEANEILKRFANLSRPFGTELEIDHGRAFVSLSGSPS